MELAQRLLLIPAPPARYRRHEQPVININDPAQDSSQFSYTSKTFQIPSDLIVYDGQMKSEFAHHHHHRRTSIYLPSSDRSLDWLPEGAMPGMTPEASQNISEAEYDPFISLRSLSSTFSTHLYTSHAMEQPLPAASSPSPSWADSQRSSFSSAPASEDYQTSETYVAADTHAKHEGPREWSSTMTNNEIKSPGQVHDPSVLLSSGSYTNSFGAAFYQQGAADWSKEPPTLNSHFDTTSSHAADDTYSDSNLSLKTNASGPSRSKGHRKMTTKEDANYQCTVKGCGKLFSRSYNYKAHLETHDSSRAYPFPCPVSGCTKKFVRKTDLQRHHQSVHAKERNHQCSYCGRLFARKDTLRRHMEDGCSKRFDVALSFDDGPAQAATFNDARPNNVQPQLQPEYTTDSAKYMSSNPPRTQYGTEFAYTPDAAHNRNAPGPSWSTGYGANMPSPTLKDESLDFESFCYAANH